MVWHYVLSALGFGQEPSTDLPPTHPLDELNNKDTIARSDFYRAVTGHEVPFGFMGDPPHSGVFGGCAIPRITPDRRPTVIDALPKCEQMGWGVEPYYQRHFKKLREAHARDDNPTFNNALEQLLESIRCD